MDVLLERRRVAVVELHPVGARRELVRERVAGEDGLEDAVHAARVDPVEVDRVRVRARWFVKLTRSRSSSVARMIGPGTVPL